jgi:alpha-beta hydrolase superfamily lysophospholipase
VTTAVQITIGKSHELFGWFHPPVEPRRECAVVLVSPIGIEASRVYRTYRHLAKRLADAGFPVARFDHCGSGNSAGDEKDGDGIRALLNGISSAIEEALAQSGASKYAMFGVRMGGTLAALAAAEGRIASSVVLWTPCLSGAAFVREMQTIARASSAGSRLGTAKASCLELSPEVVDGLSNVDLGHLRRNPARDVLLVTRSERARTEEQIAEVLRSLGCHVETVRLSGFLAMMRDAHESVVPENVLDATVTWLSERHPERRRAYDTRTRTNNATLEIRERGLISSTEVAVRFGEDKHLFGIVTRPISKGGGNSTIGVLFTSVGAIHHVGPGRLHVSLARQLAKVGVPALRFDLAGLGDSLPSRGAVENRLYAPDAVSDVQSAMSCLEAASGVSRFVVVGVCAGGHAAYHAAVLDRRVCALIAVNVPSFKWPPDSNVEQAIRETVHSKSYYGSRCFRKDVWRRLLRGEVHVRAIAHGLGRHWTRSARVRVSQVRTMFGAGQRSPFVEELLTMCDRGVKVILAYGEDEASVDELRLEIGMSLRLKRHPNLTIQTVAGIDHAFANGHAALLGFVTKSIGDIR